MRTYIKAYMSLNFGQIPPLTTELAALERLKNRCRHVISVDIDPIFFKLAGNKDMHNIMNEFEFRPDRTTDYGVSCPWLSKKYPYRPYNGENGVSTFPLLFLIGSFWYFHVTRISIKAWMSLDFLKWDLTLAHWTQVSDRCPLGYLFHFHGEFQEKLISLHKSNPPQLIWTPDPKILDPVLRNYFYFILASAVYGKIPVVYVFIALKGTHFLFLLNQIHYMCIQVKT